MTNQKSFDNAINELEVFKDSLISQNGSCLGGFELSGLEPDSATSKTLMTNTLMLANFYDRLPDTVNITQYFIKNDGFNISLKPRKNPVSHLLSQRRAKYLNSKKLYKTHLFHFYESKKDNTEEAVQSSLLIKDLIMTPISKIARKRIKTRFNVMGNIVHSLASINIAKQKLDISLDDAKEFYSSLMNENKKLSPENMAGFIAFLSTLGKKHLEGGEFSKGSTNKGLPNIVANSSINPVVIKGVNMIEFKSNKTRYARILSVTQLTADSMSPGNFISIVDNPLLVKGNYIIVNRYKPMTELEKPQFFYKAAEDIKRKNLSVRSMLSSNNKEMTEAEKHSVMSESQKTATKELDLEKNVNSRHAFCSTQILVFSENPDEVNDVCSKLVSSFSRIGLSLSYEDTLNLDSYSTFFPCGSGISTVDLKSNSAKFAANSLVYKSSMGRKIVPDYKNDEYLYPLQGKDGSPVFFSTIIDSRGLMVVFGPTRSGKSFFCNTIDSHFIKYGGHLITVQPDKGGEKIALLYGKEIAGTFKIDPQNEKGFNLFSTCLGANDMQFHDHFLKTIDNLLLLNSSKEMQSLTKQEQMELDKWLTKIMSYEKQNRTFFELYNHCSKGLKDKLSRFVRGGIYGSIFDCDVDAADGANKKYIGYNVQAVKEMEGVFPIILNEIFFRMTRLFECDELRTTPKSGKLEEIHLIIDFPGVMKKIEQGVRRWGKNLGSLSLITQSPGDLMRSKNWAMLKSSASTFVFFSDPEMDVDLYQKSCGLSDSEVDHIATLIPRKEAYVIQRALGISKKVVLDVEPEQYVINTSHAHEEQLTIDNLEKYGAEKGIEVSIKQLRKTNALI